VLYSTYKKTTVKEKDITQGPSKARVKTKHPIRTVTSSNNFNTKRNPVFPEQVKSIEETLFQTLIGFLNMSTSLLLEAQLA
jgi:hypothetical protein